MSLWLPAYREVQNLYYDRGVLHSQPTLGESNNGAFLSEIGKRNKNRINGEMALFNKWEAVRI